VDDVEAVRAWRNPATGWALWIHGVTNRYEVDPAGELIIGLCVDRAYRLRRARTQTLVRPGQLVVLDPTTAHSGSSAGGRPWEGRLMVIELADLRRATADDGDDVPDLDFPDPVVGDERLAARFLALHQLSDRPASALEHQGELHSFLHDLAKLSPSFVDRSQASGRAGARHRARRDPAIRLACDHLLTHPARNVTLDELAAVARTSKYRLVRLFTATFGLPPHAFHVAQRVALARRLIESGRPLVEVAEAAGFVDQSHLHRHFHQRLGMTPGQYARATSRRAIPVGAPTPSAAAWVT
jgi:AraC-like DNA-binding protein